MEYVGEFQNLIPRDELQAGFDGIPISYRNITVGSDATITRGTVLAATSENDTYAAATNSDAALGKSFCIARDNFTATSDAKVTTAFFSGKFHREKLKVAEGSTVDSLETALRQQNIHLTSILDLSGDETNA